MLRVNLPAGCSWFTPGLKKNISHGSQSVIPRVVALVSLTNMTEMQIISPRLTGSNSGNL